MLEAVIDVGTNSALLLAATREDGVWKARLQRESICRIGRGWEPGQDLSQDALERLEASLLGFRKDLALVGGRLRAVGMTEAVRKSANPEAATEIVQRVLGIPARVLSGEEEGRLVRRAVAARYPDAKKLVVLDLGGGSLEIDNGKRVVSMPLGAVRLHEAFRETTREALLKHVKLAFREAEVKKPAYAGCTLVAVGGTATTLVALDLAMTTYDGSLVEGYPLTVELIDKWLAELDKLPVHLRVRLPGLSAGRAEILPAGLAALRFALEHLKPESAVVSDLGLRWGLFLDAMGELP
jgi:exopolyphosphatase / guanosine-5'-triphosphate,3'-diphosphate pyrophosphatase